MSDSERGKFYKYAGNKRYQRPESSANFGSRFFNSKRNDSDFYSKDREETKEVKNIKPPTILLKTREKEDERSLSPKGGIRENDSLVTPITIATSSEKLVAVTPPTVIKQMNTSANLMEDGDIFTEHLQDYLEENNDFLVVGIVGAQSVGKSTIMNLLANKSLTAELKHSLFGEDKENYFSTDSNINGSLNEPNSPTNERHLIFDIQNEESTEDSLNCTQGIDLFINQNRIIFLDCQPFISASVLDKVMLKEEDHKRPSVISLGMPTENTSEINCLQYTSFLMSVCHVLIFAQDWFLDSNAIRFVQTAEMLKPTMLSQEDECIDHFPHFIILHNRATLEDFQPKRYSTIQNFYKSAFSNSKLHIYSGMGLANGGITSYLNTENCGDLINLYLLPEYDPEADESEFKGYPSFDDLVKHLRTNIMGCSRNPLTHVVLTEKSWLVYAAKVWEHIKKSSFYVEYSKLMP